MASINQFNVSEIEPSIPCPAQAPGMEEHELLALLKNGDPHAFEQLVAAHRVKIVGHAKRIVRNREDAEDVAQSVLLQAFLRLNDFRGQSRFSTWLFKITLNAALMKLRSNGRRRESSFDEIASDYLPLRFQAVEPGADPEQQFSKLEFRRIVRQASSRLRPEDKTIFDLREVRQLSPVEIARFLGLPVTTVRARLHRARRKVVQAAQSMMSSKMERRRKLGGCQPGAGGMHPIPGQAEL